MMKTVMVMIVTEQGHDKNLSLLKVPCYLYEYVSFYLFYVILHIRETIPTFHLRKERLIGSEFTGFEPLHRRDSSPQSLTFFRVYISLLKTYGFYLFIILLSFGLKSVCFALYMYVPLVLTFNYFVCD